MISIVLIEPEIPQNAGNIVRTCAATGSKLYLVKPLGFELTEKHFKRAGLDYFQFANVEVVDSFDDIRNSHPQNTFYFATTKAEKVYADFEFEDNCFIVFGKESYGISENILKENYSHCLRIPMINDTRSLNLSNSVAIVLYEALRQNNFANFSLTGKLTGRKEN